MALRDGALVWDAHSCLPLKPGIDFGVLDRHARAGVDFVSINVGMDFNPWPDVLRLLGCFRAEIARAPERFVLAGTVADVGAAKQSGRLAVAFDLEGSDMLDGELDLLRLYRDLGVRQMHLAYNRDNRVAGGCHGADIGLTAFGRAVVAEINRLGITMDCSHTGRRSSLEIMERSTRPVVFSHSNARALVDHPRNVMDDQITACAATGGVVGVTGVGLFLGDPEAGTAAMIRHIDYMRDLVGPAHIGLGLDFNFIEGVDDDPPGMDRALWWPPGNGYDFGRLKFAAPEQFREIADGLSARFYGDADIAAIIGGNFLRVAEQTWPRN